MSFSNCRGVRSNSNVTKAYLKMTYLSRGDKLVEVLITEFPGRNKNEHEGDFVLSIIGLNKSSISKSFW